MNDKKLPYNLERARPPDLLERDRARVAELAVSEHYTQEEIAKILSLETGRDITVRQVNHDIKVIRERWLETQTSSYEGRIEQELQRLDALERNAWQAWRNSQKPKITRSVKNSGEYSSDVEVVNEYSPGDPRFLDVIDRVQKERRKLLSLYPKEKQPQDDKTMKGYYIVSPMAWPGAAALGAGEEIVDGQIVGEE